MRTLLLCVSAWLAVPALATLAQPTLNYAQPSALLPNGMTRVTLHGDKLTSPLRVWASAPVNVTVVELTPQKAVLDVMPASENLVPGVVRLCAATSEGVSAPISLLVDALPSLVEATDNHSPVAAQTIGSQLAIDATSDGKLFDYYRFHALAGQSIAFEVLAQPLGSAFDAVVRILNEQGEPLLTVDDDSISPDCRFRHKFDKSGNYLIEVHDNKFAAGGRYRLRIGDFPIVHFPFPAYAMRGTDVELTFGGPDRESTVPQTVNVPTDPWLEALDLTAAGKDGSTTGVVLRLTNDQQFSEVEPNNSTDQANAIGDARGINGLLANPGDRDVFKFIGVKDQTWRFAAKARSFGSATMLKMLLKNSAGEVVAKTAVADTDEWQFDFKFPADGEYALECGDLLRRGGPEFAYHIEAGPAAPFSLTLKPDAKTRDWLLLQPTHGAANLDLVVQRNSHSGPIELRFEPPVPGLAMFNPIIAANAKEHQLMLYTTADWKPENLNVVRLVGKTTSAPESASEVSSSALAVVRAPHVPYPNPRQDGAIALVGVTDVPAFFEMALASDTVSLPRSLSDGSFTMTLKRIKPEFKEGVSLVKSELPPKWNATPKLDKDTMTVTVKHPLTATVEPAVLKFWWYGNLNGRGQLVISEVKVHLFEPLQLVVSPVPSIQRGQMQKLTIEIKRAGGEPQAVVVKLTGLPAGVTAPESITVPAGESQAEISISAAADATLGKAANIVANATTKLGDKEVSANSGAIEVEVVE